MRAIKYLEYREYTAAQLLYLCSSHMEQNLTVVSTLSNHLDAHIDLRNYDDAIFSSR
jgi:mRNA degradation ribonuclease J1/J2